MLNPFFESVTTIFLAVCIVGGIALIVSKKAQAPQVIQSTFAGFGNALGVAESPVTGATYNLNLNYAAPSNGFIG